MLIVSLALLLPVSLVNRLLGIWCLEASLYLPAINRLVLGWLLSTLRNDPDAAHSRCAFYTSILAKNLDLTGSNSPFTGRLLDCNEPFHFPTSSKRIPLLLYYIRSSEIGQALLGIFCSFSANV